MKISNKNLASLENFVSKKGYSIKKWGDPNLEGFYRPEVVSNDTGDVSRDLSFSLINKSSVVYIKFWSEGEECFFNLRDQKSTENLSTEALKEIEEQRAKQQQKIEEDFKKQTKYIIENREKPINCELSKDKKIDTSAFYYIKGNYYVPFYNIKGDIVGWTRRFKSKGKWVKVAVNGSTFSHAFNIVQKGVAEELFNIKTAFVSESMTTSLTIAECLPNKTVIAASGMNNVSGVISEMRASKKYKDLSFVAVLDKKEKNQFCVNLNSVKTILHNNYIPVITPPLFDKRTEGLTDFNDYRLKYGLNACKKELTICYNQVSPLCPEVVGLEGNNFKCISRLSGALINVPINSVTNHTAALASPAFWGLFMQTHGCDDNEFFKDHVVRWFNESVRRNTLNKPRGIGVFVENDYVVANSFWGKFVMDKKGEVFKSFDLKPAGGNIYLDTPNLKSEDREPRKPKKADLRRLKDCFNAFYPQEDDSLFYANLGSCIQSFLNTEASIKGHWWLTGDTGAGKTQWSKHFILYALDAISVGFTDTTEAGMMQSILDTANMVTYPAIVYDEAAPDSAKKMRILENILQSSRESATNADGAFVSKRGTPNEGARGGLKGFTMHLTSTVQGLKDRQDVSRFFVHTFSGGFNTLPQKDWSEWKEAALSACEVFFYVAMKHIKNINKVYDIVSEVFNEKYSIPKKFSHKLPLLTAQAAGLTMLLSETFNRNYEESAEAAIEKLDFWIKNQIGQHEDVVNEIFSVVDALKAVSLREEGIDFRLYELYKYKEINRKYKSLYGIELHKKEFDGKECLAAVIDVTPFKLDILLKENRSVIFDLKARLKDQINQKNGRISTRRQNGKQIKTYVINLGEFDES